VYIALLGAAGKDVAQNVQFAGPGC
jgi:hypothetical protein